MLGELLEYAITPCPWHVRRMGYLTEAIAIRARYARCKLAWLSHLINTEDVIRAAVEQCPQKRKAVIFGSGSLFDIPISHLAESFREVILVDVIHLLGARRKLRRYPNVHRLSADVTEAGRDVFRVARKASRSLPHVMPQRFCDDPEVDLVASVNLLSQIPYIPVRYLRRCHAHTDAAIEAFARDLIELHLDYLRRLPGVVALIADTESLEIDEQDQIVDRCSTLWGVEIPWKGEEWIWDLAPRPEMDRDFSYRRRVIGVANCKNAERI